jgi:hypothetical protein
MIALGRRLARWSLAASMVAALVVLSCAKQGEGERCDEAAAGNDDCESGLTCVRSSELANDQIGDRCCPEPGEESDDRCFRKVNTGGGGGGAGGAGGAGGTDGGAGASGSAGSSGTAGSAGASGSAGNAGSAGAGGSAGSDGGEAEASTPDASSD